MKFRYRDYLVELVVLGIDYPSYPAKKGERAVTTWQVVIDGGKPRIKKGSKKEIVDQVKKYIRQMDGDEFYDEHDEDDFEYDDVDEDEVTD
jgi:hypothetical protein